MSRQLVISNPDFQTPNPESIHLQDAVWAVHGRPLSHLEPGQLCALQKEAGLVPADVDDTTGTAKDTRDALGPWGLWGGAGQP